MNNSGERKLRSPNPEKEAFYRVAAEILRRGITILPAELEEIALRYGYMPGTARSTLLSPRSGGRNLRQEGVEVAITRYKNRTYYSDASLDPTETDAQKSREIIDGYWEERAEVQFGSRYSQAEVDEEGRIIPSSISPQD